MSLIVNDDDRRKSNMPNRIVRIIDDIEKYIGKYGGKYHDWRIGVRKSSQQQFLDMQFVMFKSHQGIIRQSGSKEEAKRIIRYFIDNREMGLDTPGIECGGDMIYVYKENLSEQAEHKTEQLILFSEIFDQIKTPDKSISGEY